MRRIMSRGTSRRVTTVERDCDERFADTRSVVDRGASGSDTFRFRKDLTSPYIIMVNPTQPIMTIEGTPDGGVVLDHYPGFELSISELCRALKRKLAQTRDSRYVRTSAHRSLLNNPARHSRHSFPLPLVCNEVDYLTFISGQFPRK